MVQRPCQTVLKNKHRATVQSAAGEKEAGSNPGTGEKSIWPGKIAMVLVRFYMIGPRKNETRQGLMRFYSRTATLGAAQDQVV
jgi:hypothetical protein